MKLVLLIPYLFLSSVHAFDFDVKGFLALDTFTIIKEEQQSQRAEMGIGTVDLKFYFNHEDFSAKIKLDLDGDLSESNNLYEEATISWRASEQLKLTFGKGKVPFHQMHYGILESHYIDGGSLLATSHSWRDQDRKLILQASWGNSQNPSIQHLTFWGNANQAKRNRANSAFPDLSDYNGQTAPAGNIKTENKKTFNTKKERGLAYKINHALTRELTLSSGLIYYYLDINPSENWAVDLSARYYKDAIEIWWEYVYGFWSTHPNANFSVRSQYEHLWQLGISQELNDFVTIALNLEAAFVNKRLHLAGDYPATGNFAFGQNSANDGSVNEIDNMKAELGLIFAMSKRTSFIVGVMWENKKQKENSTKTLSKNAYQLGSGMTYFF